jgi:hypothetical protein
MRIALAVEDVNFEYFLRPACERLADQCVTPIDIVRVEKTHGCNTVLLRSFVERLAGMSDLVIVATDSAGIHHRSRATTYRKKARALQASLAGCPTTPLFAIAEPCVEGWLISDPQALTAGIREGSGHPFEAPSEWPRAPKTEREAKAILGALISDGMGGALPLAGFEYADEITARMRLENSQNDSLREWANDLRGILTRSGARGTR